MEYTELADYPIPSGVVTEWIPTATTADWRHDERPISTNHLAHLGISLVEGSYEPAQPADDGSFTQGQGSWIGTAFSIDAPLRHAEFAAALRTWIDRHEAYRTTVRPGTESSAPERHLLPVGAVALDIRQYGRPRGSSESYGHLERFFSSAINAHQWPHLAAVTIEPEGDDPHSVGKAGFVVVIAADHAVMDAYTQLLLIPELRAIYLATLAGQEAPLPPCGSYVDYSTAERLAADSITAEHPAVQVWKSFWDNGSSSSSNRPASFPLPISAEGTRARPVVEAAPHHQSSLSTWLLSAEETQAFNTACKQLGGSFSTGALTALSVALHRLSGERSLRYVTPMHTRTTAEWAAAAGWFVGLAPVTTDLGAAEDFAGAMAAVGPAIKQHQGLAQHSYPRLADLAGVLEAPRFVVSFVDGRHVPGSTEWTPHDRALRSRTLDRDEVYLWINRAHNGMNLSMRFPNNEIASTSVHAMIAELSAVLREVATTGNTTVPADVDLTHEPAELLASAAAADLR